MWLTISTHLKNTTTEPACYWINLLSHKIKPPNSWGWKDLWRSSSPALCWSRVSQSRLPSTASNQVFSISKGGDSTASEWPVPVFNHPHRKKCFLMFRQNLLGFSRCPLPLVLLLGTTKKNLALSSSQHSHQIFMKLTR